LAGAESVIVETSQENNFKLSPEELREVITERSKLLVLNSPSNPTGAIYSKSELEALAEVVLEHDLFVVSDEIYERLIFDDNAFCGIAELGNDIKGRTIVVNGVSKTYAMTGWRIGYAAGDRAIISAMTKIQSQSTSNPNSIAQRAAIAALKGPQDSVDEMVRTFSERRNYLVERLNAIPGVHCNIPDGAFYAFADFSPYFARTIDGSALGGSAGLCEYLLAEAQVALVPGIAFGADDFVRFSFATSLDLIQKGLERIEAALKKLA
jgi:aspartate aminotransferase